MAYTAVVEARREADRKFQTLAEALRLNKERDRASTEAAKDAKDQNRPAVKNAR